jgi:hypothetical protein
VGDSSSEATFERIIDGNDQRLIGRNERIDDHSEEDPAELQGRPDGTVEDAMVSGEVAFIEQANGAQSGRDGAAARGQHRATQ